MNDKEYTYDIDKYTIGVDTNGEDGIGMTVAKVENGEIYFLGNCYGENARCLDLLIKENQQLKIQISAREEEYRKLEHKLLETENWLRPAILQLMKIAKQDYFWITDQQIDNAKLVPLNFTVMGDRSVKFEKLERGASNERIN